MSMFLSAALNSRSGRLDEHIPTTYDKAGWQSPGHEVEPSPYLISPLSTPKKDQNPASSLYDAPGSSSINAPSSVPPRRTSHSRRRDPDHIPRPRNAFIFFRSAYISSARASGKGQQIELSKDAGKVWNSMSPEEKRPFCQLAAIEKEQHYSKFPDYVYSPGMKASSKPATARKIGGASKSSEKKRKLSTASEGNCSRSSDTCSEPSPGSPYVPTVRPAGIYHEVSQNVAQRFVQSPSPTPSSLLSPFSDEFRYPAYAVSEIPELELTSMNKQEKSLNAEREPPAPFHPHLDHVTGQYVYQHYNYEFMSACIPPLPHTPSSCDEVYDNMAVDIPPVPSLNLPTYSFGPAPSSLLCDNPYPSADYLASLPSYTFTDGRLEGDSLLQQYTNKLTKRSGMVVHGSTKYLDILYQDQDTSIHQFFDFSMGA